ncbi:MAG: hypothetical protein PHU07_12275, partial [Acidocella sp.]|nr:hypothetical protein [Acidocella sp.]
ENLLNQLEADETAIFADAVQLVGCWAPKDGPDYHEGCADGGCASAILPLRAIKVMYPRMDLVHVFFDNTIYHHAKLRLSLTGPV